MIHISSHDNSHSTTPVAYMVSRDNIVLARPYQGTDKRVKTTIILKNGSNLFVTETLEELDALITVDKQNDSLVGAINHLSDSVMGLIMEMRNR